MNRDKSAERSRLKNDKNVRFKDFRCVVKQCPSCGHKHMWETRSDIGLGAYVAKCSKCGFRVK